MANVIKHKRGSGSDPVASDLVVGEVAIRTDVGKLFTKTDSGTVSEIAGGGSDIVLNTLSSSSGTGGGSATFNGSAYRFTLSQPPSVSAYQLLVSINGIIQKPVTGTSQPSEGFALDGNDIILGDAPATGADFFILTFKSLGVSEPADNSVTSAKIVDGAIVNADINASAAIAASKIADFVSGNTNNRVLTATGTANSLNGEANLTFSGSILTLTNSSGAAEITIVTPNNTDSGIYFNDGSNSGALSYQHSDNSMRFRVNSTEKMRIDSAGRLGLGVTPTDFHSNNTAVFQLKDGNSIFSRTGGQFLGIFQNIKYNSSDVSQYVANGLGSAYFQTSGEHKFFTAASGTANSNATLSERMRIHSSGILTVGNDPSGAASYGGQMVIATTSGGVLTCADTGSGERLRLEGGSGLGRIGTDSNHALTFITNGTSNERMRITNGGVVAIGATTPIASATNLYVENSGENNVYFVGNTSTSGARLILQNKNSTANSFTGVLGADAGGQTTADIKFYSADNDNNEGYLTLETRPSGGIPTERMRIDSSGNVGIGTTSPDRKLDVSGTGNVYGKFQSTNATGAGIEVKDTSEDWLIQADGGSVDGLAFYDLGRSAYRMVIGSDGKIEITQSASSSTTSALHLFRPSAASNAAVDMIHFDSGGQGRGKLVSASSDAGSPALASRSDYRIKENIREYTGGWANIKAVPVKLFDVKTDGSKDQKGWIAHELQAVLPDLVQGTKDAVDDNNDPIYQSVSMGLFMPDVVNALQTAIAKIEVLETKVAALEGS